MEIVPENWLITGGCGFIGVNLIETLLKMGPTKKIRIIDNLSVGTREDLGDVCSFGEVLYRDIRNHPSGVELVYGDLRNFEACLQSCKGIDVIVHLAANTGVAPSIENPRNDMEMNVIGTFNILEASRLRGIKKFIFASSGASLGDIETPIHEEKVPRPVSPYGASKLTGEAYCSAYFKTFGIKTVSLRFGNVYGQRSKHKNSVVAKFFKQAILDEPLEIYGDGNQTRDFIYIDDLIQAILLSAQIDAGGEVFQIATYKETTINELAKMIKEIVEKEMQKSVCIFYGKPRIGDVKRNYSDISKAKRILRYAPQFDLETGLKHTFEYFKLRFICE